MVRVFKFLILLVVLLVLAWWVGGLPGTVEAHVGAYEITTSTPASLLILVLIALLLTILLRVLGGLRRAPRNLSLWRASRRAERGEQALLRGTVALAAGDIRAAQHDARQAGALLGATPHVLLLRAQIAMMAADKGGAHEAFTQLAQHKALKFIGIQGLLRESLGIGDHETARAHIQAAEEAYPGAAWTRARRLELAVREQNYPAALGLTQDKAQIAALATAAAQASTDPRQALHFARQAVKADPALAPAVVALAAALRALDKPGAARKALLAGWGVAPHPLLAQAWFIPDATVLERAQDAAKLAGANPGHAESELLLAQTALAARLTGEAARHAEAALAADAGNARAQNVLDQLHGQPAMAAPERWVCGACHQPADHWAAVCPACGAVGALAWAARPPGAG